MKKVLLIVAVLWSISTTAQEMKMKIDWSAALTNEFLLAENKPKFWFEYDTELKCWMVCQEATFNGHTSEMGTGIDDDDKIIITFETVTTNVDQAQANCLQNRMIDNRTLLLTGIDTQDDITVYTIDGKVCKTMVSKHDGGVAISFLEQVGGNYIVKINGKQSVKVRIRTK